MTDEEVLSAAPVAALSAVLNQSKPVAGAGEPLPPLWHWLHFLRWPNQDELGEDGHPRDGHFLPPIPHRQRMFAGGRCEIAEPLSIGERTERTSSIANVAVKQGRTGEMVFVTQRNEFRQHGRTCLVEEQDIVYRSGKSAGDHPAVVDTSATPQSDGDWQLTAQPDPASLFRFSALTANAHRIHYDSPYVRDEEGYPGLVVHGPLLAVLMLELVRRNEPRRVRSLSFRLRSPIFAGEHIVASGNPAVDGAVLQVATHRDARHATAEVTFA
ncbi:MaoC family dehydratase N-terminal domain-containing protein [Saccharopolyspora sp. NPDC049426]|uniref:FAS1-like dehydratase domain-containing protein n=1 Tax=Saccharopolyspora sp. NPDC049426 TaxID=3155652 RepID=UPI003414A312